MVLGCRPANACHRAPPYSPLPTPGSMGAINLARSWIGDAEPCAASVDLADGYYQFAVPEVSSWFGLGPQRTAAAAGVTQVFCDEVGYEVEVDPAETLWACFGGLPMGWSWGLYFCHEALSECCRRALAARHLAPHLLADRAPAPPLDANQGFFAPYVDNGNLVAGSQKVAEDLLVALKEELTGVGFVFHEEVEPTKVMDLLGRTLDLEAKTLRPTRKRLWRLWYALDELLAKPFLSPCHMRVVLGHVVDMLCLRRELLAILCHAYVFIGDGSETVRRLPTAVIAELQVARDVLPLCYTDLGREPYQAMFCSDASDIGFALHQSAVSTEEFWAATAYKERWRFQPAAPECCEASAPSGLGGGLEEIAPEFMAWAEEEIDREEQGRLLPGQVVAP